jgi:cobalt-zinc-cadmium efflux system membrane fusion protein
VVGETDTEHELTPAEQVLKPAAGGGVSIIRQLAVVLVMLAAAGGLAYWQMGRSGSGYAESPAAAEAPSGSTFKPTDSQWAGLGMQAAELRTFRAEVDTDGKIAIDEDHATPVFSPYAGQVHRLVAQPGEVVKKGQLLFTIEATDMIQAQNDFITALAGLSQAQSQLKLAEINEQRQHELFKATAGPLKEWQQAQADLVAAQSNLKSADIALEAVRNRLRVLKKTEAEIDEFQKTGKINPDTPIYAPIDGAVVQRKVGPGQFITAGASDPSGDPVFIIGDLSTVWLIANVRESDAVNIASGQDVEFKVLAFPDRVFKGKLNFTSEVIDAATRRLIARATIDNAEHRLKPEMFARVTIYTGAEQRAPAVPPSAIVHEGDEARVWVAGDDKTLELRKITTGLTAGGLVQVTSGLKAGEKVVTKGTLFIDRAAAG